MERNFKIVEAELATWCLFDYNKDTYWPDESENLKKLLKELRYLKHIYHKHLLFTFLQLDAEITGTLGLECLALWQKYIREYWYIHEKYMYMSLNRYLLLRLNKLCPATRVMKMNDPPQCLFEVISTLPNLEVLEIADISQISRNPFLNFRQNTLTSLTVLKLEEVECILDYVFFSDLAHTCPNLNVLSILESNIKGNGHLTWPASNTSAFPFLSELTLTPQSDIFCVWEVGKELTYYLLRESYNLEYLHIHSEDTGRGDTATNTFLCAIMKPLRNLTELHLVSNYVQWSLIEELLSNGPSLAKLSAFQSWLCPSSNMTRMPDHVVAQLYCDCI